MQLSTLAKRGPLILFLTATVFYLYGLGDLSLLGPDEPRYAQIAREMFLNRDLITPTLAGHPWFEKPALLYWMMIASYKLFGVSEWSARLPAAVSGLLIAVAVFWVGRSVEKRMAGELEQAQPSGLGFWSALAALTTLGIVVFSRAASFDIVVTMTISWALSLFFISELQQAEKSARRYLVGFYAFMGVSLLAKGLIGFVIPLGVVGAYFCFRRRLPRRSFCLSLFWGLPVAVLVAAVWYGPVIGRHGWPFVDQFFVQHQFARYVSNKYRHPAPVYFYLLILLPLALPWTAFVIEGFWTNQPWRKPRATSSARDQLQAFAFAWLLVPLLFFSFSTSKLPGYILPVLPAIALIAGESLTRFSLGSGGRRWPIKITAGLCLAVALIAPLYAWRTGMLPLQCVLLIALLLGVAGGLALLLTYRRATSLLVIAGATLGVVVVALNCLAPKPVEQQTAKYLIQLADARGYSTNMIYGMQRADRTPEFYAPNRVVYGADGEPVMYEHLAQVIDESKKRNTTLLAFVPLSELDLLLRNGGANTEQIGNNGRVALVAVKAGQNK